MGPVLNYSTTSPCIILPHIPDINEKDCFSLSLLKRFVDLWLPWVFVTACGLSLVVVSGGYSRVGVHELLGTMVSLVAEHEIRACGL